MPTGQAGGHNKRAFQRGGTRFGPRHSSPQVLQNSPESPNIAPIPGPCATQGPQVRLFTPAVPVSGIPVAWGSGALVQPVPIPLKTSSTNKPVTDSESSPEDKKNHSKHTDKHGSDSRKHRHSHGEDGKKPRSKERSHSAGHHADRRENPCSHRDLHVKDSKLRKDYDSEEPRHSRRGALLLEDRDIRHKEDRVNKQELGYKEGRGNREDGEIRETSGHRDDRWHREERGHRGAILLEDRDSDNYDQSDPLERDSMRTDRRKRDDSRESRGSRDTTDHRKDRGHREDREHIEDRAYKEEFRHREDKGNKEDGEIREMSGHREDRWQREDRGHKEVIKHREHREGIGQREIVGHREERGHSEKREASGHREMRGYREDRRQKEVSGYKEDRAHRENIGLREVRGHREDRGHKENRGHIEERAESEVLGCKEDIGNREEGEIRESSSHREDSGYREERIQRDVWGNREDRGHRADRRHSEDRGQKEERWQREGRRQREDRRSGGESVRSSRLEDDRESLDSQHRGRNIRHEREHRALLIEDRDEDRPRSGGARLIEDFVDPREQTSDRGYKHRGDRGSDRESDRGSRGIERDSYMDSRDYRDTKDFRRSSERDRDQQRDSKYARSGSLRDRDADRERDKVRDRGKDYRDNDRESGRQYPEYSERYERNSEQTRSGDLRDRDRFQEDWSERDHKSRHRDDRLEGLRDSERSKAGWSERDDRNRDRDIRPDNYRDRDQRDLVKSDDRDRDRDIRPDNYRDRDQRDLVKSDDRDRDHRSARDDRGRNRDDRSDNFWEFERGQGDYTSRDDRDRDRDYRSKDFRDCERGQGDWVARDNKNRCRDDRSDDLRGRERGHGDWSEQDDRGRNRDHRLRDCRDNERDQGDWTSKDDKNRSRDHRLEEFKYKERGQGDWVRSDDRDRTRDHRSDEFRDHERSKVDYNSRDDRGRNREYRSDDFRGHKSDSRDWPAKDDMDRNRDNRSDALRDHERSWPSRDSMDRNRDYRSEDLRNSERDSRDWAAIGERDSNRDYGREDSRERENASRDWTVRDQSGRRDSSYRDGGSERSVSQDRSRDSIQRGRTGAVLIEDRNDSRPVLPAKIKDVGRTGALLIEDRAPAVEIQVPIGPRRGQDRMYDHRGHGRNSRERSHARSEEKSQERSLRGHKRAWCSSQDRWREDSMLSDRDSIVDEIYTDMDCWPSNEYSDKDLWSDVDSEPEYKRRRLLEAVEEESKVKCIRSGSPAIEDPDTEQLPAWVRSSAADLYFTKDYKTGNLKTTKRMQELEKKFDYELVQRNARARAAQPPYEPLKRPEPKWHHHHHCQRGMDNHDDNCSSSSSSDDSDSDSDQEDYWLEELRHKENNPYRLHKELWHNEKGELNYAPLCRCSIKARRTGIRHDKYPGEEPIPMCDLQSNNLSKLYHYKITVSPVTNFLTNNPTIIMFDGHEYIFEGFSIFTHKKLPKLPECQFIRFYIVYTLHVIEEPPPENFSIRSLDLFSKFLFDEILELLDIDWKGPGDDNHCRRFHVMPRFARPFPENGKEILSMNDVLLYLLKSSKPLVAPKELSEMLRLDQETWQKYVDGFRYMIVTCPGKKPSSIRIDQLDKQDCETSDGPAYPLIIHHGLRPAQLSYAGDPIYKKKWREYMKFRHLLWSRTKVSAKDKEKIQEFEVELQQIRSKCTMKREITVEISCEEFLLTGIRADICQHAMLLPVLFGHIRFHDCLTVLERTLGYEFKDKSLLQLALTHCSYKVNHGTNPDHGRNSLSNCGSRSLEFGDHKVHNKNTRKRGLNVLLHVMSKMAKKSEEKSDIPHNERLEYLGDAVVEFVSSTHLFYMFPHADEGELTSYRGSLVQNAQLAVLANKLKLQDFLLYAHGPDLCHARDLRHAMANCFEAVIGALFMDGGIELADRVFSYALFDDDPKLLDTWINLPKHPLQEDEPSGDRHWIKNSPTLQKLLVFENDIGYEYCHIRLLAKAFTQRNIGYNHLTMGHNQRLEFLGDTIMKLISSDYLYRHFPDHHEGHLTLLRSSLVNNRTQSTVAEELGMPEFVINMQKERKPDAVLKQKEKADLLEAYLGSLYVDGGLAPCYALCNVCFFPRLEDFILTQEWNDPKSQLQQCCPTLRDINDESPDIPLYKVLSKSGPTNSRVYKVGVYFRGKRLAIGQGHSKQLGEMKAAENALKQTKGLFQIRALKGKVKGQEKNQDESQEASQEKDLQSWEQKS